MRLLSIFRDFRNVKNVFLTLIRPSDENVLKRLNARIDNTRTIVNVSLARDARLRCTGGHTMRTGTDCRENVRLLCAHASKSNTNRVDRTRQSRQHA